MPPEMVVQIPPLRPCPHGSLITTLPQKPPLPSFSPAPAAALSAPPHSPAQALAPHPTIPKTLAHPPKPPQVYQPCSPL
jgi:hypothetical protein